MGMLSSPAPIKEKPRGKPETQVISFQARVSSAPINAYALTLLGDGRLPLSIWCDPFGFQATLLYLKYLILPKS